MTAPSSPLPRRAPLADGAGTRYAFGAPVTGVAAAAGRLAYALGDGTLRLVDPAAPSVPAVANAHAGACLSLAAAPDGDGFLSGGDDGRLVRVTAAGDIAELLAERGRWVEHVAAGPGAFAAAIGKTVHLFKADGQRLGEPLAHPSTVQGLALSPNGKRVAASHYNGVSLWWANGQAQPPKVLAWKGSHLSVTFSPDLRFVVTAMQESALHGWRVADGAHFRMTGYPAKIRRFAWLQKGRWLATTGAGAVILWPFAAKDGPMDKSAKELGWGEDVLVTDIAAHPGGEFLAAGYADGAVSLYRFGADLPVAVERATGSPVSAIGFSTDGRAVAFGTEAGHAALVDLSSVVG
jgi:WD40 repeat protein